MSNSAMSSHWQTGSSLRRMTSSTWTRSGSASAFATAAMRSASSAVSTPADGAQQAEADGPGRVGRAAVTTTVLDARYRRRYRTRPLVASGLGARAGRRQPPEPRHSSAVVVYELPPDLSPVALLTALGERLTLAPDRLAKVERTYLDTFDGLVRGAGLTLFWEDGRLVASDGDERELAGAACPQAPNALFAGDVPAGGLRNRLERTIEVRAAIPIARIRLRR